MNETSSAQTQDQAGLQVIIEGRVQGVGFRMFVQRTADDLGLVGWVRNKYNGNVEVWAEGARQDLDKLLAALRKGPPAAVVIDIHTQWKETSGEHRQFSVRSTN